MSKVLRGKVNSSDPVTAVLYKQFQKVKKMMSLII